MIFDMVPIFLYYSILILFMPIFSHLHVHTQYSILDGAASIKSLYKKAINDKMPALAITDHGNMFGAFEFVAEAYKNKNDDGSLKVKPVVGCEFYVVENRHKKQFSKDLKDDRFHQVLLAKNAVGYQNLLKLTSLGYVEGLYSKYPRIDKELIEKYHEGLIATTCCLGAYVPQMILRKSEDEAETEFKWWLNLFGEDYYVEIQRHGLKEQDIVNKVLLNFAEKHQVKVIASNDSHYTDIEDYNAHDILLCINTGEKKSTPGFDDFVNDEIHIKDRRFKFPNNQFYFKSTAEMNRLFADIPQAIDYTNEIVSKVELLDLKKDILLPEFPIPSSFKIHQDENLNQFEFLKHLTYEGAKKRYHEISPEIEERLQFELHTIKTMGFAGYFLIVSDFIQAGREMDVYIGPGRGSAAGSVVAYCIGITNIDPIKYDLLFERFLNPGRKSMPDIDTDFDDEGRQKVIDYVVNKYSKKQVAQIITYGTMAAKSSIKDVARVLDLPLPEANVLAKLIPDKPGTELKRVLHAPLTKKDTSNGDSLEEKENYTADDIENIKKVRQLYSGNDLVAEILHEAERLEGNVRNTGVHAAGIIIAPTDLTDLIPIATSKDSDLWVTQIDGKIIEEAGVIKMDFLGLKTLTILKNAVALIKQNHKIEIVVDDLPLDDEKTYELLQKGNAIGVFQFEAPHLVNILKDLKPTTFEDLIALNALNRPGPAAYIPVYIKRKHGLENVEYDLPEVEEYLSETFGITVYQEQVMLLAQKLANFSKASADDLRKAMGKKDRQKLDSLKNQFIEGGVQNKLPNDKLEKIWKDWEAFASYAFNKSHSTCYALVAYQTAYLKAHYPSEFMAAVLNNAGSIEKITFFMEECRRMELTVLGPDINESFQGFAVNKKGEIRFGLGGLKGVGEAAIESLIEERNANGPFQDVFDVVKRVNLRTVNKKCLENLVYSGALECFTEFHRAQYFYNDKGVTNLESIITFGNRYQSNKASETNTLFGDLVPIEINVPKIANCEPWTLTELLDFEKEVTGMFMSGHPLDHFRFELELYGITPINEFNEFKEAVSILPNPGKTFQLAGLVTNVQHRISKTGKAYGSFTIEDYTGKTEFMLFSNEYIKYTNFLEKGLILYISGNFAQRYNQSEYSFQIKRITLLETIKKEFTKQFILNIQSNKLSTEFIQFLDKNLRSNPGKTALKINIINSDSSLQITFLSENGFAMNDELIAKISKNDSIDYNVVPYN